MNRKFTLQDMERVRKGIKDIGVSEDKVKPSVLTEDKKQTVVTEQVSGLTPMRSYLVSVIKDEVSVFDPTVFDKTVAFTKFFLSERGVSNLHDTAWYTTIAHNYKVEFLEFYEFFLKNNINGSDASTYVEDFKSFFSGDYLRETERYEKEIQSLGAKESVWYKGIMDAFNQEPNNDKFWEDDEYYMGYQRGTDIFRGLMKEAKLLFPVKKPKNKFVEQQQQLAQIIKKFEPKKHASKSDQTVDFDFERMKEIQEQLNKKDQQKKEDK